MFRTLRAVRFLFTGPLILAMLFVINLMTGGPWWVQWAALGIGIAWIISLLRVIRAVLVMGGLEVLIAYLTGRARKTTPASVVDVTPRS